MKIQMLVAKRPNMFSVADHALQFIGMGTIESAFKDAKPIDGELTAYYPERFLNVQQQQDLVPLLERLGCTKFSVVTISPLLIQNVRAGELRIPCGDEDEPIGSTVMCNRNYMDVDFDDLFSRDPAVSQ